MNNIKIEVALPQNCECFKELKKALERYIKYASPPSSGDFKLLLVPLYEGKECVKDNENCWEIFKNYLLSNQSQGDIGNCNAVLFLTFEETPRGDFPDSLYNKSRALRMFVENTMKSALTANHRNIFIKLKELVLLWETRRR